MSNILCLVFLRAIFFITLSCRQYESREIYRAREGGKARGHEWIHLLFHKNIEEVHVENREEESDTSRSYIPFV